jgi:serine/threonine protein kinase
MKNKINLFRQSGCRYYLSIEKNINVGDYAVVSRGKLKSKSRKNFLEYFVCGAGVAADEKCDEVIEDDFVVKVFKSGPNIGNEIDNLLELQGEPHILHIAKFKNHYLYGKNYFVTTRCRGGDLYEYIHNRTLSESDIKIIAAQLIQAIRECHRHNIIHGDIKLENIGLVNEDDISDIKLLDFGGSIKIKNTDELCHPSDTRMHVSPHYIPPEMILPYKMPSKDLVCIDFWELGVVLFALLTNQFPYKNVQTIAENRLVWPSHGKLISAEMKTVVEKLLVKDPKRRYNTDVNDLFGL